MLPFSVPPIVKNEGSKIYTLQDHAGFLSVELEQKNIFSNLTF
jgi:hypothetical protein